MCCLALFYIQFIQNTNKLVLFINICIFVQEETRPVSNKKKYGGPERIKPDKILCICSSNCPYGNPGSQSQDSAEG